MHIFWFSTNVLALVVFAVSPAYGDDDDTEYVCEIGGDVEPCGKDDNYKVTCDLKMHDNGDHVVLNGSISMKADMDDKNQIEITINKITAQGNSEPVFSVTTTICAAIKETDAPWYSIIETMGLDGCPAKSGTYPLESLRFDLDSMSGFLNNEYVGEYECQLVTTLNGDTTSCHSLKMAIMEKSD